MLRMIMGGWIRSWGNQERSDFISEELHSQRGEEHVEFHKRHRGWFLRLIRQELLGTFLEGGGVSAQSGERFAGEMQGAGDEDALGRVARGLERGGERGG